MRHRTISLLASLMLSTVAHAHPTSGVDIFPSQSWESLKGDVSAPAEPISPASTAAQAPGLDDPIPGPSAADRMAAQTTIPFHAVGEWVEGGQRVIVVENGGQTYLLCQRCELSEAIRPGGTVAKNYRLRALETERAVLLDPQGQTLNVSLTPLAQ